MGEFTKIFTFFVDFSAFLPTKFGNFVYYTTNVVGIIGDKV